MLSFELAFDLGHSLLTLGDRPSCTYVLFWRKLLNLCFVLVRHGKAKAFRFYRGQHLAGPSLMAGLIDENFPALFAI